MRTPLVAGNWKMFKTVAETRHLVSELVPGLQAVPGVQKVICRPTRRCWQPLRCWKARISA
jgi:triosephosphate isomerase (TIM)